MNRSLTIVLMMIPTVIWCASPKVGVELIQENRASSILEFTVDQYELTEKEIDGQVSSVIQIEQGTPILKKGAPHLPKLTASLAIPSDGEIKVEVIKSYYSEKKGVLISPSKGNQIRGETSAYIYGPEYTLNQFYPSHLASHREPYFIRHQRGVTIVVHPIQYNPVTRVLRIYHMIRVKVSVASSRTPFGASGHELEGASGAPFDDVFRRHFINQKPVKTKQKRYQSSSQTRYTPVGESGKMLVISNPQFVAAMQPFVDWKNQKGIPTEIVTTADIGGESPTTNIKPYIANYYNTKGLTYVLLVGDKELMPTLISSNQGGEGDPMFSYIVGGDQYPDIFVGRFSAETVAQVETMVTRSIQYEKNQNATATWLANGVGIGSNQNTLGDDNELDYEHIRNIRKDLLKYTYVSVAELYDGSQGGEDMAGNPWQSQLTSAVNTGVGIINYAGHGSDTGLATTGVSFFCRRGVFCG